MNITIDTALQSKCPQLQLGCIQTELVVAPSSSELLELLAKTATKIAGELELEAISQLPVNQATREAYKALGKKPGRYRPSAEALIRRVVSGKGLYQINNVVDFLNYISVTSHFSIGGYDLEKIQGDITLGIGKENEPYDAIARGALNIANLPLFRDTLGPFGSPTSDSTRTMVRETTRQFLMVIFNFGGHESMQKLYPEIESGLQRFCQGRQITFWEV